MVSFGKKSAFTTTLLVIIVTLMGRDNVVLAQDEAQYCTVPATSEEDCTKGDCSCDTICLAPLSCGNCPDGFGSCPPKSSVPKLCSVPMTDLTQCTNEDCTCDIICPVDHPCANRGCVTCSGNDTPIRGVIVSSLVVVLAIISMYSII